MQRDYEKARDALTKLLQDAENYCSKEYGIPDDYEVFADYLLRRGVEINPNRQMVYVLTQVHQCKYDLFDECDSDCLTCRYHSMQDAIVEEEYDPTIHDRKMGTTVFWSHKEATQKLREKTNKSR